MRLSIKTAIGMYHPYVIGLNAGRTWANICSSPGYATVVQKGAQDALYGIK